MGTMGSNVDVVFLSATRTPFGSFGGSLKDETATDLAVHASDAAVERSGVEPAEFDHVYYGNVIQTSADAVYLARHVGLRAGLPEEVPAVTVNRLCGSGFQAVVDGAQQIVMSEAKACLTGGTESMSQAPHVVRGARWGMRLGPASDFEDVLWEALTDTNCGLSMAETAEKLAQQYEVTRQEVDEYALRSHRLAAKAWDEGKFDEEVVPVPVEKRGKEELFERDEDIRTDTSMEALSGLRPYFRKDGLVTAGNASGIGDGAASLVVASSDYAEANGLEPMGRIVSWAFAGVDPSIMGIGPAPAIRKALDRADLTLDDMDVVEVNEAFAPQYMSVEKELGLDREKVNVNGGAIALTHPLGATGARITGHLLYELRRRGGGVAVGSACIGGGQGGAIVVEV